VNVASYNQVTRVFSVYPVSVHTLQVTRVPVHSHISHRVLLARCDTEIASQVGQFFHVYTHISYIHTYYISVCMYVCLYNNWHFVHISIQNITSCTRYVCMYVPLWTDLLAVLRDMCISCVCMYVCMCVLAIVHVSVLRANSCIQIAIHETVSPTARLGLAGPRTPKSIYMCTSSCVPFCMCVFTVYVCMYVCMYAYSLYHAFWYVTTLACSHMCAFLL